MIRYENGRWVLYSKDGSRKLGDFDTEQQARDREAEIQRIEHAREGAEDGLTQARTSTSLDARPFLVDGVALSEAQIQVLANLVAGIAQHVGRQPMDLAAAVDVWKRRHVTVTEGSRRVWQVHSASPTYRAREAEVQTEGDPATETLREAVELRESRDAEGRLWEIVALREGWSKNGKFYTRACVQGAVPLFEGLRVCAYGWSPSGSSNAGHVPDGVRAAAAGRGLVLNEIGLTSAPTCRLAEDGRAEVVATLTVVDPTMQARLRETWQADRSRVPGFSIDGAGDVSAGVAEGRRGWIVNRLTSLTELTLVSEPAAGGAVRRLVAGNIHTNEEDPEMNRLRKFLRARLQESKRAAVDALDEKGLAEAVIAHLKEMQCSEECCILIGVAVDLIKAGNVDVAVTVLEKCLDAMSKGVAPEPMEEEKPPASAPALESAKVLAEARAAVEEARKVQEAMELARCETLLTQELREAKLTPSAQELVRKQFAGQRFKAEDLLEAIKTTRQALAEAAPQGGVSGQSVGVGTEAPDRWQAKMDRVFGYLPKDAEERKLMESRAPRIQSIRDLYLEMTGDEDFAGRYSPDRLQEAMTSASFANLMSVSMEKRLLQDYETMPETWRDLVEVDETVTNFKTQDVMQLGGFGVLPTVAEAAEYSDLGTPREEKSTYSVAKRGGKAIITLEMVMNDDLRILRRIPTELADAAYETRARTFYSVVTGSSGGGAINSDTAYDGVVIYHPNHRNIGSTALSFASLSDALIRLKKQFKRGISTLINDAGNIAANATSITVDSTTGFHAGDVIQIEAELIKVAAITSATVLDVTGGRGYYGTTAAAHNDNTRIYHAVRPKRVSKRHLIFPEDLAPVVDEIAGAVLKPYTATHEANPYKADFDGGRLVKHEVPAIWLGGDTNNWFLLNDPAAHPGIVVAFLNNRQTPEVLLQDQPTVGNTFSNDQLTYKLRDIYGGIFADPFAADGNIVA